MASLCQTLMKVKIFVIGKQLSMLTGAVLHYSANTLTLYITTGTEVLHHTDFLSTLR